MDSLRRFLLDFHVPPCSIVAAVSGGADSTALLLALSELRDEGYSVVGAHINHALRGIESDEDEAFVRNLCRTHDVPFRAARGELDVNLVRGSGLEAAAREVRYELLESIRAETGARYIATGHTRRDQAETLIMRFLTGSGRSRLRGIAPVAGNVIRPLLDADRDALLSFLHERGVEPRHDSSNDDPRFLRNRIRHEIVPRLLEINPNLYATLAETAKQTQSEQAVLDDVIRRSCETWVVESSDSAKFFLDRIPEDRWLVQAALARQIRRLEPEGREVSATDLTRLASEIGSLRRTSVSRTLELVSSGSDLVLRQRRSRGALPFEVGIEPEIPIEIPQIRKRLTLRSAESIAEGAFRVPSSDGGRFVVRSRKPGDRFHPEGRSSEKSLSDILIERRIPREVRDSIPILTWNGEIVSVMGLGVSERFRAEGGGEDVYVIILEDSV